jgi:hypothetical protein
MTKENATSQPPRKAKHLAIQGETLTGEEDAHERAKRRALDLLDRGFHLGGVIRATRDDWHER